jgi:hypothetical protein
VLSFKSKASVQLFAEQYLVKTMCQDNYTERNLEVLQKMTSFMPESSNILSLINDLAKLSPPLITRFINDLFAR